MLTTTNKVMLSIVLCLCVLIVPAAVLGQNEFELTDNGWTYGHVGLQEDRETDDFEYSYFYDSFFSDNIYLNSWWYRTTGDTREYGFTNLTSFDDTAGDNTVSLSYEEPGFDGEGANLFRFDLTHTLVGVNQGQAYLRTDWSITNLTSGALTLDLFNYIDFDVDLDSEDDYAEMVSTAPSYAHIRAWDTGSDREMHIVALSDGLSGWEIAPWPFTLFALSDDSISNLMSASSMLGPDELACAYQYTLSLAPDQSLGGTVFYGVDVNPVPEPGSLAGLLTGIVGLAGIRRFRRK